MGGEGSMAAANASLKNNRSLLAKRKEKNALSGSYINVEMKAFPEASPQGLKIIKEKIQKENRVNQISTLVGFICMFFGFAVLVYFLIK